MDGLCVVVVVVRPSVKTSPYWVGMHATETGRICSRAGKPRPCCFGDVSTTKEVVNMNSIGRWFVRPNGECIPLDKW